MSDSAIPAPVGRSVYFVSFLFVAMPVLDLLSQALPAKPHEMIWRYGLFGLLGNQLLTPLLGVVLASVTAHLLGHRRTARAISIASLVLVAALLAAAATFSLDALQLRARVQPQALRGFQIGAGAVLVKYALSTVAFGLVAAGGRLRAVAAAPAGRHAGGAAKAPPASVLVR
jgi:hypothetical protein